MKVALVHDWLVNTGGAEMVLWNFHEIFQDAPIYTLIYDNKSSAGRLFAGCDVRSTFLQKLPFVSKMYRNLLTLMPLAWEQLDMTEYDFILSSCSSCCKGIITRPDAVHVCYCHTPTRYIWDLYYEYYKNAGFMKKLVMPSMINRMRVWDRLAADRVDYFIANSEFTRQRIKKYYKRDSQIIYACGWNNVPDNVVIVDTPNDYYLIVSRLVRYKRIDIAIEACNRLKKRLVIIGSGEEENSLKNISSSFIEFKGRLSNEELYNYYTHAKALIFPGTEDFGSVPLEAQSGGCPVIAYGRGGALETIVDGRTGKFFCEQTTDSLVQCILDYEKNGITSSRQEIRMHAMNFSAAKFRNEIKKYCDHVIN